MRNSILLLVLSLANIVVGFIGVAYDANWSDKFFLMAFATLLVSMLCDTIERKL